MKTKIIAIQGVKGAFHEEAARKVFGPEIEIMPCMTFQEVGQAVLSGRADNAVMAIENTISGTILSNLELIRDNDLQIMGEIFLRIRQNLGVIRGASLDTLEEVHSHYMALNQCRAYFQPHRHIQLVESVDTALSLREVAEVGSKSRGAIGSKLAIEHYGLELIAEGIESDKRNFTRFAVLRSQREERKKGNKVSMAVTLPHQPGALARIISLLHLSGSNLTKVESTPILGKPFQYCFFIDFILGRDVDFASTMAVLRPNVLDLKIMGRFPASPMIES